MERMSRSKTESLEQLARILLAVSSVSIVTALGLGAYLFFQWNVIAELRGQLLSEIDLQTELLAEQELDQAVMPHFSPEVGFVLNPYLKESTLWGFDGRAYSINWLGLRGPNIAAKQKGTTRVVIVGDSVLFGWHLEDDDRLSEILNRRVDREPGLHSRIEFVTAALPGWNVRSEVAFLERHIRLLDPDAIVWWAIPNDIEDVAGVIPPGRLASWASPQKVQESPFAMLSSFHLSKLGALVPSIRKKQVENIERVEKFQEKYPVPVFMIGFPGLDAYVETHSFSPNRIHIPREILRDERWSLTPTDGHPSPWANRQLASGILHELIRGGIVPEIAMDPEESAIGLSFGEAGHVSAALEESPASAVAALVAGEDPSGRESMAPGAWRQIPEAFALENRDKSVVYGVDLNARMAKTGAILLRGDADQASQEIVIRLELPANMSKFPGSSVWTVRDRFGGATRAAIDLEAHEREFRIPVPLRVDGDSIFEISWEFDYSECDTASRCWSARLLAANFES